MTEMRSSGPRSTIALDTATGGLRMGDAEHRVDDPTDTEQVYGAYLSLLYAVRGARRGEELPLRSADLDALLTIVGDDTDQIERRLVELMGCTAEEASMLRRVLVRHRALAASVGAVAGISLVALLGPTVASATTSPSPAPTPSATSTTTPADPTELAPLTSYATTDEGEHVPVPESWTETEEVEAEQQVAVTSVSPSPSPSPLPSASASPHPSVSASASVSPSPSSSPSPTSVTVSPLAAPEEEVVLGDPMAPIDRPGWSPEDEVVLGDPMAPIDRPGWSPEDEVVLGDPMTPIDRPAWLPEGAALPVNTGAPIDRPGWSPEDEVVLGEPMTPIDRVAAAAAGADTEVAAEEAPRTG